MKKKICYELKGLDEILSGYKLKKFDVRVESEDYDIIESQYYFCLPIVKSIYLYKGVFWDTLHIKLEDGTDIKAESENVNVNDASIIRINNNNYVSPKLNYNDGYVESTDNLRNWLVQRGVAEEDLKGISKEFTIYEEIEYCGVLTPSKWGNSWGYSSNSLILQEQEIETVLNSIDDELLRKKIECILYARVFKKR